MFDFTNYKQYVLLKGESTAPDAKHTFYKLEMNDIEGAESRLNKPFPRELRAFYEQIGYGFLCSADHNRINRLMDPASIADFVLGEDVYAFDPDREMYVDETKLVFFEVLEGTYLTLDLQHTNENGQCPIYYFDVQIADTLEEFLNKMDVDADYYL